MVSSENSPKLGKCNTFTVLRNSDQMLSLASCGHGPWQLHHYLLGLLSLASCLLEKNLHKGLRLVLKYNVRYNPQYWYETENHFL